MTRDDVTAALERGLMAPAIAAAKVPLFEQCDRLRATLRWAPAEHAWWIPGRLEVFGKHTDYAGGRTLVAALPRGFALTAGPGGAYTPGVAVADAMSGAVADVPTVAVASSAQPGDGAQLPGWTRYVETVVRRLSRNFPGVTLSAQIVMASDLPPAAGMSSSSALVVGLAAALVRIAGIESRDEWRRNITGSLDAAAYFACVENGATFRDLAGDTGVGTHGGSEDHAAILCATPSQVSAFAFVPLRVIERTPVPPAWRFVVASSGVRAEKTGAARDAYNALSRDASELLRIWNEHEAPVASLGEALATDSSAAKRLVGLLERLPEARSREALVRRLTHFLLEDRRVAEAIAAFGAINGEALSALASDSQRDAEALLRNQISETVALVTAARRLGAIGASAFGAGFGGSVWAIVDTDAAHEFPARWLAACRPAALPEATAFEATPAPPLIALTP